MNCEEIEKLLPDYLTDNVSAAERSEIAAHLSSCPGCQTEAAQQERTWGLLGKLSVIEPEPGYVSRFWTRLAQEKPWHLRAWDLAKERLLAPRISPVYLALGVVLLVGYMTLSTTLGVKRSADEFSGLNNEQVEFLEDAELAENYELIQDLDVLIDLDMMEDPRSPSS